MYCSVYWRASAKLRLGLHAMAYQARLWQGSAYEQLPRLISARNPSLALSVDGLAIRIGPTTTGHVVGA